MEDIGGDRDVHICKRQRLPKWPVYRLDICVLTSGVKCTDILISESIRVEGLIEIAGWIVAVFTQLISGNGTLGAPTIERTRYQSLLWVITDENGENGMTPVPDPITGRHPNTGFAIGCDRG
jgi:hypothetical protein